MTNMIPEEELIAFVAGQLDVHAQERIETAAQSNPMLAARIQTLKIVRDRLNDKFDPGYSRVDNEAAAQALLQKMGVSLSAAPSVSPVYLPTAHEDGRPWSPRRKRWTMAALAAQSALCLGLLGHLAFPVVTSGSKPAGVVVASRSVGVPAGHVVLMVNFAPQTTEKEWRGLLLRIEAQLISGPSQLGEYQLSVAGNVATAALQQLHATPFVESAKAVQP